MLRVLSSSLVNSSGTTSRSSSLSPSFTPRLFSISAAFPFPTALLIFATSSCLANHLKSQMNLLSVFFQMSFTHLLVTSSQAQASFWMQSQMFKSIHNCIQVFLSCSNRLGKGPCQVVGLKSCCNSRCMCWINEVMSGGRNTTLILG